MRAAATHHMHDQQAADRVHQVPRTAALEELVDLAERGAVQTTHMYKHAHMHMCMYMYTIIHPHLHPHPPAHPPAHPHTHPHAHPHSSSALPAFPQAHSTHLVHLRSHIVHKLGLVRLGGDGCSALIITLSVRHVLVRSTAIRGLRVCGDLMTVSLQGRWSKSHTAVFCVPCSQLPAAATWLENTTHISCKRWDVRGAIARGGGR